MIGCTENWWFSPNVREMSDFHQSFEENSLSRVKEYAIRLERDVGGQSWGMHLS